MDVRGPDHRHLVERRRAATLRSGVVGAGRGGSNRRAGRPRMAQALAQGPVDTGFWGTRAAGVAAPRVPWGDRKPPHSARHHFEALPSLADRLIFDSADFARPDQVLPAIARVSEQARGRFGITDLNWTRLTPWREIVSTFFDVPAYRPFLDVITGVRVGFAVDMDGRDIHPSQALLFVGWLASRLGWRATQSPAPAEAGGHPLAPAPGGGAPMKGRLRAPLPRRPDEGGASGASPPSGTGGAPTAVRVERPPA